MDRRLPHLPPVQQAAPHPATTGQGPKRHGAGLSLYQVVRELQTLLALWTGACPTCHLSSRRPRQPDQALLGLLGIGPITAAQILVSWSHQGRFRSEAAFASFAGVSPIPASSGLTNRHRLNRSGDRQLNRAMHTITLIRMRLDPSTKTYVARKITEGKTSRDAQRCLKRVICRQIFKILERPDRNQLGNVEELAQAA
nr:IS110 family transposase [Streptomyces chengmaiensis]